MGDPGGVGEGGGWSQVLLWACVGSGGGLRPRRCWTIGGTGGTPCGDRVGDSRLSQGGSGGERRPVGCGDALGHGGCGGVEGVSSRPPGQCDLCRSRVGYRQGEAPRPGSSGVRCGNGSRRRRSDRFRGRSTATLQSAASRLSNHTPRRRIRPRFPGLGAPIGPGFEIGPRWTLRRLPFPGRGHQLGGKTCRLCRAAQGTAIVDRLGRGRVAWGGRPGGRLRRLVGHRRLGRCPGRVLHGLDGSRDGPGFRRHDWSPVALRVRSHGRSGTDRRGFAGSPPRSASSDRVWWLWNAVEVHAQAGV